MKKINFLYAITSALAVTAVTSGTASADLDFTAVTGAVSSTAIVTAITALAAIKIAPGFAKWGFNKVIGWFR